MNSSKISRILIACAALAAGIGTAGAQESTGQTIKQDAKTAGHAVGDAGRDVGHATRDTAVKVGHGARDAGVNRRRFD